jgi:hypothetical protein
VQIVGPGAELLKIDAQGRSRAFQIDDGNAVISSDVAIAGVTIANGQAGALDGGGIYSAENLTLRGVLLTGNKAKAGGGLRSIGGSLSVIDSRFVGNEANRGGGAMIQTAGNGAAILITGSTFEENRAIADSLTDSGRGGGIFVYSGGSTANPVRIKNSVFSSNRADVNGGGILLDLGTSAATLASLTLSDNAAGAAGGGLYSDAESMLLVDSLLESNAAATGAAAKVGSRGTKSVELLRNTFQENSASTAAGVANSGMGGALYLTGGNWFRPVAVRNSTLSQNTASQVGSAIAAHGVVSILNSTITLNEWQGGAPPSAAVHNLNPWIGGLTLQNTIVADNPSGNLAGTPISPASMSNLIGEEARLAPYATVLGAHVYIPQPDSGAIDAGNTLLAAALTSDQRGADFRRVLNGNVDIGAIEATVILDENNLLVYGTDKNDEIWVYGDFTSPGRQVVEHVGVFSWKTFGPLFASITAFLLDGDDVLKSEDGSGVLSERPIVAHGGEGSDTILGGNAADTIRGDGGNDSLFGKSNDDVLLGGAGSDQLYYNGGDTEIIRLSSPQAAINEGSNFQLGLSWPNGVQQATISWGDGGTVTAVAPQTTYTYRYERDSAMQINSRFEVLVHYINSEGDAVYSNAFPVSVKSIDVAPPTLSLFPLTMWTTAYWANNMSQQPDWYQAQWSPDGLNWNFSPGMWLGTFPGWHEGPQDFGYTTERFYFRMRAGMGASPDTAKWSEWSEPIQPTAGWDAGVVRVRADVSSDQNPTVTLSWPDEYDLQKLASQIQYKIERKTPDTSMWSQIGGGSGTTLGTSFTDVQVVPGTTYEYRVTRISTINALNATGHVAVAVNGSPNAHEARGCVVLLVDSRFSESLSTEIARLTQDLGGDGWLVVRKDVDIASESPEEIHSFIRAAYEQRKTTPSPADDVRSVFLLGHIPTPFGWAIPDGHLVRGVAADAFYGDMDHNVRPETTWTDVEFVETPDSIGMGVRNVPGDGIFDQSVVPADGDGGPVELSVGRVDMHLMGNFDPLATYTGNGQWQQYTIDVGQFYTGTFPQLTLISGEHTADGVTRQFGQTEFMDIVLHDFEREGQTISSEAIVLTADRFRPAADTTGSHRLGWDGRFSGGESVFAVDGSRVVFSGNAWKVASIDPVTITPDTWLEVKMRFVGGGDKPQIIGIGFDHPTPNPISDRDSANGGGYEQVAEEFTFRLHAADHASWGREIDPTLETELLRRYLNKDHAFRNAHWNVRNRALIDGDQSIRAGWDNMAAMFGDAIDAQTHVFYDWRLHASDPSNSYLWGFGGRPGTVWGTGPVDWTGVMDAEFLARSPSYVVFTEHEGSISVEWERSDSLLRSIIANDGYGLTSTWIYGNRFDYYHMGAGGTVGDSLVVTQNRGVEFGQSTANADVWLALMGDPTLRMHIIAPPANVRTDEVQVMWDASTAAGVESYNVYRAAAGHAPGTTAFERIGSVAAATTSFRDPSGSTGGYQYMVRAVKREDGPSGAYYNLSQGAFSHGVSPSTEAAAGEAAAILPAAGTAISVSQQVLDLLFDGALAAHVPSSVLSQPLVLDFGAATQVQLGSPKAAADQDDVASRFAAFDAAIGDELLAQTAHAIFRNSLVPDIDVRTRDDGTNASFFADALGADIESFDDGLLESPFSGSNIL